MSIYRIAYFYFIFTLLAILSPPTSAAVAMIYQPHLSHMSMDNELWPILFKNLRDSHIDTLVVQWTRYDDYFIEGEQASWLEARVIDAANAGLKIVVGLSSASDIFKRLEQPASILPAYFRKLREKDRAQISRWEALIPSDQLQGWYLPIEIDDKRWRLSTDREVLIDYLQHAISDIRSLEKNKRSVYLSSFFTGQMSPQRYSDMIHEIHLQTKIQIWIQDGSGIASLSHGERGFFLNELTRCQSPTAQGIIYELFREIKEERQDKSFKAVPTSARAQTKTIKNRAPCHLDTVYFGLNYWSPFFNKTAH